VLAVRAVASLQLDPSAREIRAKRVVTVFIALVVIAMAVACIGWIWLQWEGDSPITLRTILHAVALVIVFAVVVLPGAWWLVQRLTGKPLLRIDSRGIVWGRDWNTDVALRWDEIAEIRAKTASGHGVSDPVLLVIGRDMPGWRLRYGRLTRLGLAASNVFYGSPTVISTVEAAIPRDELIALIRRHYRGPIDLTGWR
jgi:hypothetical protein